MSLQTSNSQQSQDFNAISVTIASPDQILSWSHGEVTKPETINYRTQKPERDGLFCEKIFGPTKNWECACGKYKRVRYKGVVCERCGVEVTRSVVRRERMAHIDLAVPVSHVWYLRSTPSRVGLLIDLPVKILEQVVYFALYIVTRVDHEERVKNLQELEKNYVSQKRVMQEDFLRERQAMEAEIKNGNAPQKQLKKLEQEQMEALEVFDASFSQNKYFLDNVDVCHVMTELDYRDMSLKYGHIFEAGMGAESLRKILEGIEFDSFIDGLKQEMKNSSGQKQKKILKRIRLALSLKRARLRPEWLILTRLPILPPDLRPMIQLDGGRFAASDLNDLYRRVINRNNRLRRLIQLGAPDVICRNEKRMLQEAVDTLLNNTPRSGRSGFTAGDRRRLKSLSDMLKGKQGRFRQNLLGKRVDYSGRSVIVVGPDLKLHQCGLPKTMALKLFKPFVIGELIRAEFAFNVKGAERLIQSNKKIVWDMLDKVIKGRYVLLNRAPTLHRLGIQAFEPILIEGKAIQIHPLVCAAFNADFDGDAMTVHVPLSDASQKEAREYISARNNILKPTSGQPIISPSQDMIVGLYYLTNSHESLHGEGKKFRNVAEAINVYRLGGVDLQANVWIRVPTFEGKEETIETTVGRAIFNSFIPTSVVGYQNKLFKKKQLSELFSDVFYATDSETTAEFADSMKRIGFKFATKSGISMSAFDLKIPENKPEIILESERKIKYINSFYERGVITDNERYVLTLKVWAETKNQISDQMVKLFESDVKNHIFYVVDSAARGNWGHITQLSGMKGLVANPSGKTIELPIKSNLLEGFTILEYFNGTHAGRKGKADTALKTASAGYLTRRLVDAVHDIIVKEHDCGTLSSVEVSRKEALESGEDFETKIYGRTLTEPVVLSDGTSVGEIGQAIDRYMIQQINTHSVEQVFIRSILACETENGVCQKCYGRDLAYDTDVAIGTPVGIIAAQAIGEPGTQLTMRTFHSGGVAEAVDITQGLPRVEELFESRDPKTPAVISEISGTVHVHASQEGTEVTIEGSTKEKESIRVDSHYELTVKVGDELAEKQVLAKSTLSKDMLRAPYAMRIVELKDREIIFEHLEKQVRSYYFKSSQNLKVLDGQTISAGTAITEGHFNLLDLIKVTDIITAQKYILNQVQKIYSSQGQTINDKHIEIIVKQMFSKVKILDAGDTSFLPGETVDFFRFLKVNKETFDAGKKVSHGERLILGLSRVSLATDSWLSAASFQETIRVLVDASMARKVDKLAGLKENVILGRPIMAGEVYRNRLMNTAQEGEKDQDALITGKIL